MGFLARLPAMFFVAVLMTIAAFAIAVEYNDGAKRLYENHVKEFLEGCEFFFTWISLFYFVLPMISYTVVHDWTKTFYDCFTPQTMWLDAVYSGVVILQHILFIGEIPKSNGRIMAEYGGMALLLSCVYGYVMLKSSNYPDFDRDKGQKQNIWALIFLAGFGFAALMQMQFQYRVPAGYSVISKWLAATGIVCQGLQPVLSIIHRALPGGTFDDDAPSTANIKITAAVLRMITLSYDYWMCSSKGYHDTPNRAPFAAMVCFSLIVNCVMVVTRYIGPRKLKDSIDAIMKAEDEEIRRRAESREMEDHLETLNLRGVKNMTAP